MAVKQEATVRPTITPEERAARRQATALRRLAKDRVRMLDTVQTLLRQAAAALATDDFRRHDQCMEAAKSMIGTYETFVLLNVVDITIGNGPVATPDA